MNECIKFFFKVILNFFWLPAKFLITKGKLLKLLSPNNKLLSDKWLSLLEEGIRYKIYMGVPVYDKTWCCLQCFSALCSECHV